MGLKLGDTAPNFTADTTEGNIDFHEWLGDGWGVLMSHPADFTPVCTTEIGATARLKDEFDKRGAKAIVVSVDSVEDHKKWAKDIEATQGVGLNLPLVGIWLWLLRTVPARVAASVQFLQPVFGIGASAAMFGDPMGPLFLAGVALVLMGVGLSMINRRKRL